MKTKALSVLYFLTGMAYIVFENESSQLLSTGLKGLIMPLLIIIFIINFQNSLLSLLMLSGLVFSVGRRCDPGVFIPAWTGMLSSGAGNVPLRVFADSRKKFDFHKPSLADYSNSPLRRRTNLIHV